MLAPIVLQLEEEMHVWREEKMRDYNFWDDPVKSNEMLANLADRAKVIDTLKDLVYKVMLKLLFLHLYMTYLIKKGSAFCFLYQELVLLFCNYL